MQKTMKMKVFDSEAAEEAILWGLRGPAPWVSAAGMFCGFLRGNSNDALSIITNVGFGFSAALVLFGTVMIIISVLCLILCYDEVEVLIK